MLSNYLVTPALRAFKPDLIVVASGYDASCVDPLARMMATSETFRAMTNQVRALANEVVRWQIGGGA